MVRKRTQTSNKIFVLDTSAIMSLVQDITTFRDGPGFATTLGDNEIVVPRVVLDELDKLRHDGGERGKIALDAARQLEYYANQGSLLDGVETEKGGVLRMAPRPANERVTAWGLKASVADHEILATAMEIEDKLHGIDRDRDSYIAEGTLNLGRGNGLPQVILITQDRILRVLAKSIYNVRAEELKSVCAPEVDNDMGYHRIEVSSDEVDKVIKQGFYEYEDPKVGVNEFFHLVDRDSPDVHYCYAWSRDLERQRADLIDRTKIDYLKVSGDVTGRNIRQKLLLWVLMGCGDPDPMTPGGIRLVTISGPPGSGKSFLTVAAAWERLERGYFERIVVTRPMVEIGHSLGFLPGTLEEKLRPWGGLIEDNLRAIVQVPSPDEGRGGGRRGLQRSTRPFDAKSWLEMENRLELIPLSYIRGRTFRRTFVVLEEAQNIERGPLKVLLTRLGEGSVIVVVGDHSQVDNQFLSRRNNGLVHAINGFHDWPQAVHMYLDTIVRSDLAEAASVLL